MIVGWFSMRVGREGKRCVMDTTGGDSHTEHWSATIYLPGGLAGWLAGMARLSFLMCRLAC
jgi:hypothetical protein